MKRLIILAALLTLAGVINAFADDNAYLKAGPLSLSIPLKTARIAYGHDFGLDKELIFGETPVASLWNRIEGTIGAVTSTDGVGSPTIGGDLIIGNILEKWVTLPQDINVGAFYARNFNLGANMYGVKASIKLW